MKRRLLWTLFFVASQYSPGVMQEVVGNRVEMGHLTEPLPRVDGYVAVRDCEHIGKVLWMAPVGGEWESFLVVDCAMPKRTDGAWEWMTRNNIQVELDHESAVRLDTVEKGIKMRLMNDGPRITR